jgi:outer membrane protein assembly factor BamA
LLLGGERSVRGVPENQIGVPSLAFDSRLHPVPEAPAAQLEEIRPGLYGAVVNAELRYTLVRQFFIGSLAPAIFTDWGVSTDDFSNLNLFPSASDPIDDRFAYSFGAGLRLVTPVGPISADVAYAPPRKTYNVYLTLGYVF